MCSFDISRNFLEMTNSGLLSPCHGKRQTALQLLIYCHYLNNCYISNINKKGFVYFGLCFIKYKRLL